MEFACGFIYVPPVTRNDGQRPGVTKRSALLPPVNRVRPRMPPPPPPPTNDPKNSKIFTSTTKIQEQVEKSQEVKKLVKPESIYENEEFYRQTEAATATGQQQTFPRKTALLPPHMRPAANSRGSPSHDQPINSQVFTHDLPQGETDLMPEYVMVLPSRLPDSSSQKSPSVASVSPSTTSKESSAKDPLPGNPNVVLISLGKLLSEEKEQALRHKPTLCPHCGSVLDSCYYNVENQCHFCQFWEWSNLPHLPPSLLFSLNPDEPPCAADPLLLFCIDISGSMSITSQVTVKNHVTYESRLEFVQEAVVLCVQRLSEQQPDIRVGLITFNNHVRLHGYGSLGSHILSGADLIDSNCIKEAAASFPTPPPLSLTKDFLQSQVKGLTESGTTALGPAALLAVAMASRQPGSKVIICTDGKANTGLGNLEEEENDARTLLSSTIFYQDLGEYAANQGVTVSVLSIEGTDCRLDELGRLADRTSGRVVIASPNMLHQEFENIIMNRTIATHCSVTLLLPKSLSVRGERESAHKAVREVGNVDPDTEITIQFGASQHDSQVSPPASGSCVSIQLQIRFRQKNGQTRLRVITANRDVTDDSSAALSSLSLAIIQLNSSQVSAALAVRGRFLDARKEGELQKKLIERAIEHNHSVKDKETYQDWVKTMEPIYNNIHDITRFLTDAGAVLLYNMKHCNRKSISEKRRQQT
ncbi:circularly permutated Ras protein 1-like isoform X2 [Cynoglossus semilaevis]|uniref:circularly permutated Ras protein 1-like isoform X2 n=1 Tax=Cynoglossus semilaevis TaxID=244447 RepID=UPI0007DC93A0|nr:circularly permutated Ras protein 1-like isoform X2 [Cynoglossus semilaevis]